MTTPTLQTVVLHLADGSVSEHPMPADAMGVPLIFEAPVSVHPRETLNWIFYLNAGQNPAALRQHYGLIENGLCPCVEPIPATEHNQP